jgi:hypothetical protein
MKFMVFAWLVAASFAFGQQSDGENMAAYLPAGRELAKRAYLAQGARMRVNTSGMTVYAKGPIMGLTKEQAAVKFYSMWAASPETVRMNWAKKAMFSGVTVESQQADAAARAIDEQTAENRRATDEAERARKIAEGQAEAERTRRAVDGWQRDDKIEKLERDVQEMRDR